MMDDDTTLCCTLCGVWIKQVRRPSEEWLTRVRAIRSYQSMSTPFLTGIGFLRKHDACLFAPSNPSRSLNENLGPSETELHDPVRSHRSDGRCFIFHEQCWVLLASKVELQVRHGLTTNCLFKWCSEKALARQLFNFLVTVELHDKEYRGGGGGGGKPPHDYGGASSFLNCQSPRWFPLMHKSTTTVDDDDDILASIPRSLKFLCADPFDMSGVFHGVGEESVVEWKYNALNPTASPQWKWWLTGGKAKDRDVFSKLPDDIIHQIAAMLPSDSIRRICRASGVFSKVATRDQLPQSFWATRFLPDAEMGFMTTIIRNIITSPKHQHHHQQQEDDDDGDSEDSDEEEAQPLDWRQAYFDIERALQSHDHHHHHHHHHHPPAGATEPVRFMGIKNRSRIWKGLDYFTDSIVPMLRRYQHRTPTWLKPRSSHLPMEYSVGARAGPLHALMVHDVIPLTPLVGTQEVLWPCDPATEPLRLAVSRIRFAGKWFVSGLRVRPAYGMAKTKTMTSGFGDDDDGDGDGDGDGHCGGYRYGCDGCSYDCGNGGGNNTAGGSGGGGNGIDTMEAGLTIEEEEQDVVLERGDRLLAVKVLYSSSAIIGLDFRIGVGGGEETGKTRNFAVNWLVGDDATCYTNVHQDLLEPMDSTCSIAGFNVGLDAFRIESMGLIFKARGPETHRLTPRYPYEIPNHPPGAS